MTKICPKCNKINTDSARFCENCGEELKEAVNAPPKNKEPNGGVVGWWNKQTSGVKVISIAGVFCLGILLIFFASNTGPIGKEAYEDKIIGMDKEFREIIKDNSMYTTAGTYWRDEEPVLKNILKELNQMEQRGIPSEYKTFNEHFKKSIEYYLLWQNTANDEYGKKFSEEDNKSKELWDSVQ